MMQCASCNWLCCRLSVLVELYHLCARESTLKTVVIGALGHHSSCNTAGGYLTETRHVSTTQAVHQKWGRSKIEPPPSLSLPAHSGSTVRLRKQALVTPSRSGGTLLHPQPFSCMHTHTITPTSSRSSLPRAKEKSWASEGTGSARPAQNPRTHCNPLSLAGGRHDRLPKQSCLKQCRGSRPARLGGRFPHGVPQRFPHEATPRLPRHCSQVFASSPTLLHTSLPAAMMHGA